MAELTVDELIQDIHAMDEDLWQYESCYGLRSQYFYELYQAGQLRDDDSREARGYADWAASYEIRQHREELYDELIRGALQKAKEQRSVSLTDLKLALGSATTPVGA